MLEGVAKGDYEQFSSTGAAGDTVYGYAVKPTELANGEQYPVAFLIHGGPQGSFSNHFHYRWNPQTYAGIESRFVYFPDENHWVLKPHNSIKWHREVNDWLHRFLDE